MHELCTTSPKHELEFYTHQFRVTLTVDAMQIEKSNMIHNEQDTVPHYIFS